MPSAERVHRAAGRRAAGPADHARRRWPRAVVRACHDRRGRGGRARVVRRTPVFRSSCSAGAAISSSPIDGVDGLVLQIAIGGVDFTSVTARRHFGSAPVSRGTTWWPRRCPEALRVWNASRAFRAAWAALRCRTSAPTDRRSPRRIAEVTVLDRQSGEIATLSGADCGFGYRTSRFKRDDAGRFVVCEVRLRAQPGTAHRDAIPMSAAIWSAAASCRRPSPTFATRYCRFGGQRAWSSTRRIPTHAASDRFS